jgi:hypothetical protein
VSDGKTVQEEWRKALADYREQNKRLLLDMAALAIRPEETSLLHARIDCLIDSLAEAMGDNGEDFRLLAHTQWQERLNARLRQAAQDSTKTVLGQGASLSSGQIAALARETGTPGWNSR